MKYKIFISKRAVVKTLPLLLSLLLGVNFLAIDAQASTCENGGICLNCVTEGPRHAVAAKSHHAPIGCGSKTDGIPCDLEGTETPARTQFALTNDRPVKTDFSDITTSLSAKIVPATCLKPARSPLRRGYANLYTPIYLQNLSLRC